MKLTSIVGTGTGKLGGSVFSVRNGAQVVRTYQPIVANPQSAEQVEQRAKLKLASQLSAALGHEVDPFGRDGLRTPRNLFVKDLFSRAAISFADGEASINMTDVRLTNSRVVMFGAPTITRTGQTLSVSGGILPDYIGDIVGMHYVVVVRDPVTAEPFVIARGEFTISTEGSYSAEITSHTTGAATLYLYAYTPGTSRMVARFEGMTMDNDTAVLLATSRDAAPSEFDYSITYATSVAAAD